MRASNALAENMFAQVNGEENRHVLLQDIVNHRYDSTEVKEKETFIKMRTRTKRHRETTEGVEVLAQWKDGSTTCANLKDMNNSYPVHMSEYTAQHRIAGDPVFKWWIRHVMVKCNRTIGNLKSKYWVQMHKFGIKISKSVQEAKECDEDNGNNLWWDAICK